VEITTVETWLHTILGNDATLAGLVGTQIYSYAAPKTASFPLVIYQFQGGHDVRGVGPARIMTDGLYVVKAVDRDESFAGLKAIAERVDALLQGAKGETVDGSVLGCVREQPLALEEAIDGVKYRHLGGIYRVWAQ
jgi:hypothetical protein